MLADAGGVVRRVGWVVLALVWVGCGQEAVEVRVEEKAAVGKAQRIVSFVPSLTEIAFDLGLGPKVVGVSDFDTHPPEVKRIEKVGGLFNPNLEKVVALDPDLVLIQPSLEKVRELAEKRGTRAVVVRTDTLEDVFECYRLIGEAAGIEAVAKARAEALREALGAASAPKGARRPKVLLVVGRQEGSLDGLTAAGRGSFLDQLLERAGGENVLGETPTKWPQVSKEVLLASPPEVIIELSPGSSAEPVEVARALEPWSALGSMEVVKEKRVFKLVGEHLLLPGPRSARTVEDLRRLFDPLR